MTELNRGEANKMTEYINKDQLLAHLFSKQEEPMDVMKEIAEFPAACSCYGCNDLHNCTGGCAEGGDGEEEQT